MSTTTTTIGFLEPCSSWLSHLTFLLRWKLPHHLRARWWNQLFLCSLICTQICELPDHVIEIARLDLLDDTYFSRISVQTILSHGNSVQTRVVSCFLPRLSHNNHPLLDAYSLDTRPARPTSTTSAVFLPQCSTISERLLDAMADFELRDTDHTNHQSLDV